MSTAASLAAAKKRRGVQMQPPPQQNQQQTFQDGQQENNSVSNRESREIKEEKVRPHELLQRHEKRLYLIENHIINSKNNRDTSNSEEFITKKY